jgi:DNA-binding transcriptional regulator YiaG
MTPEQLRQAQAALNITNGQLCKRLGIAETTLCNWKAGRITIPLSVDLAMKYLLQKK